MVEGVFYKMFMVCFLVIGDGNTYCEGVPALTYEEAAVTVEAENNTSFIYDQQESKEIFDIIMDEQNGGDFSHAQ